MLNKYIIIGLGNPEPEYSQTRHNVGKLVIDALATQIDAANFLKPPTFQSQKKVQAEILQTDQAILAKPMVYMNQSGQAVRAIWDYYQDSSADLHQHLYVIHDDLDLSLGSYKIQLSTGPKAHNGLESIYQHLGTKNFWHVRVGVDHRTSENRISGREYVLHKFLPEEHPILKEMLSTLLPDLQKRLSIPL